MKIRKSVIIALVFVAGTILFSSCSEVIEEITYTITINNNSSETLELWLSVDSGTYELAPGATLAPGESISPSLFVANTRYEYQARRSDGTVYTSRVFEQNDTTDQVWDIN